MTFEEDDLMITYLRNSGVSKKTLKKIEMNLILKYCYKMRLTERGIKRIKMILDKFWNGVRLPDDEVRLLPLVSMYYTNRHEEFASHLMSEVRHEVDIRFGNSDELRWKDWYLQCGYLEINPHHRQDVEDAFDEQVRRL